jgi:2-hydroxychromene-2-carboxylate isomerase
MGEVIRLAERMEARRSRSRRRRRPQQAEFFFDLACPFTYLAAERVERAFERVRWTPACGTALRGGSLDTDDVVAERLLAAAEARANELRLPLVWPERFPAEVPLAMRVAAFAAEKGRGAAFALAASRLAFCGGFDLDHPEILAEASAAAGLAFGECLQAAGDPRRDGAAEAAGRRLLAAGADRLPVLRLGQELFAGERQIAGAATAARMRSAAVVVG